MTNCKMVLDDIVRSPDLNAIIAMYYIDEEHEVDQSSLPPPSLAADAASLAHGAIPRCAAI